MEELDKLLEKLTEAAGLGYTGDIRKIIAQELEECHIHTEVGPDGSVHGFVSGAENRHVMLACHIDEIGFMVSHVEDNGFVRFSAVGGCDIRVLPGQEVIIIPATLSLKGEERDSEGMNKIKGYIGAKPPHLMAKDEKNKVPPIDELFIDTGLPVDELTKKVKIGDGIVFAGRYRKLQGDLRSAKSLDNRASVACSILVLRELTEINTKFNVHFVATSQEEYTGLGARIYSYKLPIDYAIVIDVAHGEHPDLSENEFYPLGNGPTIGRGSTIPPNLFKMLVATAKEIEIPYQIEPLPSWTGTDADAIAFNREGIPTCVLGIPLRYMHTPIEVVSLKDIERTARLIVNFIKKL